MENMRFKVDDRVRIKSLDWYNKNKDEDGIVELSTHVFIPEMVEHCGTVVTIKDVFEDIDDNVVYYMKEIDWDWTDEMIEGLVEEENNNITETVVDTVKESNDRYRIVIDPRFDIEVDEGEYYAVRRKREYPKTYEECCKVLNVAVRDLDILDNMLDTSEIIYRKNLDRLLNSFRKLLICRDAYWKIAGEEMGLGKPWEPDWKNSEERRYCIVNIEGDINLPEKVLTKWILKVTNKILVFPTEEMRDAFYENFDKDLEFCKELL